MTTTRVLVPEGPDRSGLGPRTVRAGADEPMQLSEGVS